MPRKATKKTKVSKKVTKKVTTPKAKPSFKDNFVNYSQIARTKLAQIRSKRYFPLIIVAIVLLIILAIVPHLVVAVVDGHPITVFQYYSTLDQKYGADTKDQLISEQLIMDEASKRGVSVTNSEVNDQIQKIQNQASGSANLDSLLAQQGLTRTEFQKQVYLQALIQKMFASDATVSAAEIDSYISANKDQFGTVTDQTRQDVSDQLSQQKLSSAFQSWLQAAQSSTRVSKF